MQRKASAVWKGGLKDGKGTVSATSGVLSNTPYSFATRFENTPGTNPEELIAAAHAACFSMALSAQLGGPISLRKASTLPPLSPWKNKTPDGQLRRCISTWLVVFPAPMRQPSKKLRRMPKVVAPFPKC